MVRPEGSGPNCKNVYGQNTHPYFGISHSHTQSLARCFRIALSETSRRLIPAPVPRQRPCRHTTIGDASAPPHHHWCAIALDQTFRQSLGISNHNTVPYHPPKYFSSSAPYLVLPPAAPYEWKWVCKIFLGVKTPESPGNKPMPDVVLL